jgi:hypothetical protein
MPQHQLIKDLTDNLTLAHAQIHGRNLVIEGCQAQLIVQGLGLNQMKKTLEAKENDKGKKKKKDILYKGRQGFVATDEDIQQALAQKKKEEQEDADEKERRKVEQQANKEAKEKNEEHWQEMKTKYQEDKNAHETLCHRLRGEGVLVKNLPAPPRRPLHADLELPDS